MPVLRLVATFLLVLSSTLMLAGGDEAPAVSRAGLPDILTEILVAAGVSPSDVPAERRTLEAAIDAVVERVHRGKPNYNRARRVHRILHKDYLRDYDHRVYGLEEILLTGRYNCLSATLFHGLIARELGYDVTVLDLPGHVLLRFGNVGRRPFEVETTSRGGFDSGLPANVFIARNGHRHYVPPPSYAEVTLEQAIGYVWLNTAVQALDSGQAVRAAHAVRESRRRLPYSRERADQAHRLFGQAFRIEYDAGRFDEAYRIARIDVELYPDRTTSRDRLLAAALKWTEILCDEDAPASAEDLLDRVRADCPRGSDVVRLERQAAGMITVAAVRVGDWDTAWRAARRYAALDPDPTEADRLLEWVEQRQRMDTNVAADGICPVPTTMRSPSSSGFLLR